MIIADTGFFVALGNQTDRNHLAAIQFLDFLQEPLITTYPVITETCYLLAREGGINAQCDFLDELAEEVFVLFTLQSTHVKRAIELMRRYADLPMDFADASLVVLAEHLGHGRILTVDRRDFNVYRWNNQNPFENLLLR
jgi:uncharacterized protein